MDPTPCLCTVLRQAALTASDLYDRVLAPSGLKINTYRQLLRIGRHGRVCITALAEELGLDRSTLGRNLRVLERQGLVAFEGDKGDERRRSVRLTDKGRQAKAAADPLWELAQQEMEQRLGTGREELLELLNRFCVQRDAIKEQPS